MHRVEFSKFWTKTVAISKVALVASFLPEYNDILQQYSLNNGEIPFYMIAVEKALEGLEEKFNRGGLDPNEYWLYMTCRDARREGVIELRVWKEPKPK